MGRGANQESCRLGRRIEGLLKCILGTIFKKDTSVGAKRLPTEVF